MVEITLVPRRTPARPWKPTREDLDAARDQKVPDLIAPHLKVLFVGINPGLYSAAVRHHFARPGNRFWPALYRAGFSTRLLSPFEERALLADGYGITNVVARATASAAELAPQEFVAGAQTLVRKLRRYRPRVVAFLGVGAYRQAFGHARAQVGPQADLLAASRVWVLPNPSGLNANYQLPELVRLFEQLRVSASEKE